jgi:hypothetical protein
MNERTNERINASLLFASSLVNTGDACDARTASDGREGAGHSAHTRSPLTRSRSREVPSASSLGGLERWQRMEEEGYVHT